MRVYVWQAYGHIQVYAADGLDDLERLFNTVAGTLESWGVNEEIEKARVLLEKGVATDRTDIIMRSINMLVDIGKGHESFEYNAFTTVEQPK